jgi:hypothetical protein
VIKTWTLREVLAKRKRGIVKINPYAHPPPFAPLVFNWFFRLREPRRNEIRTSWPWKFERGERFPNPPHPPPWRFERAIGFRKSKIQWDFKSNNIKWRGGIGNYLPPIEGERFLGTGLTTKELGKVLGRWTTGEVRRTAKPVRQIIKICKRCGKRLKASRPNQLYHKKCKKRAKSQRHRDRGRRA